MRPEDFEVVKKAILPLMRAIDELRAEHLAAKHILSDLLDAQLIAPETAQILQRFETYRDEELERARVDLETTHPELAAELDRGRDEPSANPPLSEQP